MDKGGGVMENVERKACTSFAEFSEQNAATGAGLPYSPVSATALISGGKLPATVLYVRQWRAATEIPTELRES